MTTTGDFFVDGVRDDVQTYRDLYNIERLEIFRGPNAMTFGRGGTGGIINRVTKAAGWEPVRELRLEAGMYDHYPRQRRFRRPGERYGRAARRPASTRTAAAIATASITSAGGSTRPPRSGSGRTP